MTIRSDRPYARRANRGPDGAESKSGKKNWINYPRAKSRIRWMRWLPSLRLMLLTGFLITGAVVATVMIAYARTPLPGIADITKSEVTIVYWADGSEMTRFEDMNRVILPNDKIPQVMKDATVGAEDRSFWTNKGISVRGIGRAAYNNVRGRPLQGGSTLTQQYVKNVLLNTQDRTAKRKFKEFFIAVKIARKMDKNEILAQYLNTIYFGRNCYGVEAASQCYFGHPASKLTVSEAAYLAGIINGPELYDPYDGASSKDRATRRWNYALDGMVVTGKLTQAERDKQVFPKVVPVRVNAKNAGQMGYLRNNIRKAAKTLVVQGDKLTDRELDTGGLRIRTTLDRRLIDAAVKLQAEELPGKGKKPQLGLVSIDPTSGAVRAVLGGTGFTAQNQYNQSTQTTGQLASTAKIFCLIAALEKKQASLKSRFEPVDKYYFPNDPKPVTNSEGGGKDVDLIYATAHSINTVYAPLNQMVGWRATADVMVRAGLPENLNDPDGVNRNLRNVLGTNYMTPLQLASAYSTIAAQGIRRDPYFIETINSSTGAKLYAHRNEGKRVFAADVMADVTYAMQEVVKRGTGSKVRALDRPVAGKTGTATDNVSAWFAGFTPQMTTVVRLVDWEPTKKRNADGSPILSDETVKVEGRAQNGGDYPAKLWTIYMKEALGDSKVLDFPEPAWVNKDLDTAPSSTSSGTATTSPTASASVTSSPSSTPTGTVEVSPSEEPTPSEEPSSPEPTPSETPKATTTKPKTTPPKPTPGGSPSP